MTCHQHLLKTAGLTLVIVLGLLGCSKITQENYAKLEMGMDYAKVVEILGEPTKCESILAAKNCTWGKEEEKNITMQLVGDKVVLFQGHGL